MPFLMIISILLRGELRVALSTRLGLHVLVYPQVNLQIPQFSELFVTVEIGAWISHYKCTDQMWILSLKDRVYDLFFTIPPLTFKDFH